MIQPKTGDTMYLQKLANDKRTLRMAVITVATAVLLVLVAPLFGTGLRADSPESAVSAGGPASLDARAKGGWNFYVDVSNSAAEANLGNSAVAAAPSMTIRASHYARLGSLTPAEAASLGNIAPSAAPASSFLAANPELLGARGYRSAAFNFLAANPELLAARGYRSAAFNFLAANPELLAARGYRSAAFNFLAANPELLAARGYKSAAFNFLAANPELLAARGYKTAAASRGNIVPEAVAR
jgi:hypothetical protein